VQSETYRLAYSPQLQRPVCVSYVSTLRNHSRWMSKNGLDIFSSKRTILHKASSLFILSLAFLLGVFYALLCFSSGDSHI
jgi:hypothetical protein